MACEGCKRRREWIHDRARGIYRRVFIDPPMRVKQRTRKKSKDRKHDYD